MPSPSRLCLLRGSTTWFHLDNCSATRCGLDPRFGALRTAPSCAFRARPPSPQSESSRFSPARACFERQDVFNSVIVDSQVLGVLSGSCGRTLRREIYWRDGLVHWPRISGRPFFGLPITTTFVFGLFASVSVA